MAKSEFTPNPLRELQKTMWKGVGMSEGDMRRPFIGIANAYGESIAGHMHFRTLAEHLKKGIYRAGGVSSEFGTIAPCDGLAGAHNGNDYVLPSRDVIADSIELIHRAHVFDGIVILASCDKIVPAALMAAARLDIPAMVLVGGPMVSTMEFNGRKGDLTSIVEAWGMHQLGVIDQQKVDDLSEVLCPTCGSCQFYGTANSMCCLVEALGMSLPGSALIPATYNERTRDAIATGEAIVNLVKEGIRPSEVMSFDAIKNGIRIAMATGMSTNVVLHLMAITNELGYEPDEILPLFNEMNDTTPQIVQVNPAATYDMEDFYKAGGIPRVMQRIKPLLNLDVITSSGKTLGENIEGYRFLWPEDDRVIKTLEDPVNPTGGLVLLKGNVAPDTCVAKPSGIAPEIRVFTGPAVCFDSEEECSEAIAAGKVKKGDVIVLRYEGPRGGPGMREMVVPLKTLKGRGILTDIALISDGRFSGTNNGCFVGHISPEAAEGGPLAIIRDGDIVTVDTVDKREVNVHLSDEEIVARLADWKYEPKKIGGVMGKYMAHVRSANTGAVVAP
ncbi:MAG: dihydroxy-acid dehydratase [Clostridiales Family XIII bacterium]|jgi:dihydroxy-acid dehydratase|nr:dihydroxy-acid dehydratase [Clostridiales Family XIII bacterium]